MLSHATIPHWSPTVQVNIKRLIDDVQCYQTVRELRWPMVSRALLVHLNTSSSVAVMIRNPLVSVMHVTTVIHALMI